MDDPALDPHRHCAALRGLQRLNRWSGSAGIVWSAILSLARQSGGNGLRLLDLATGAGDVPIGLMQKARRAGLKLQIDACDASPTALEYAQRQAIVAGCDIRFFRLDAPCEDLPTHYDILVTSLFLHHLADEGVVQLLGKMASAARRLVIANDLRRSRSGIALAYFASRLLTTSAVVHVDAVRSVRAAFTLNEIRDLAIRAGLHGASLDRRWPCRFLLRWMR